MCWKNENETQIPSTNLLCNPFFLGGGEISTTAALRGDEDKIKLENIVKDGLCICSKDKKLRH